MGRRAEICKNWSSKMNPVPVEKLYLGKGKGQRKDCREKRSWGKKLSERGEENNELINGNSV